MTRQATTRSDFARLACCVLAAAGCLCAEETPGKLTIYMAGKPVATESYSVQKSNGKIELSGTGNADLGTLKINIEQFDVVTDEAFQPVSVAAKATMGQLKMATSITFADGKAKSQVDSGQGPTEHENDVHPGVLVVNANLPIFAWTILALRVKLDTTDPQQFYAFVLGQTEVPVSVVSKGKDTVEFAGGPVELNHLALNFAPSPTSKPLDVDVWIDDSRKMIKVSVPAQNVEAYQAGFDRKAPPPEKPEVK